MKKWKLTIEQKEYWKTERANESAKEMFSWKGQEYIFEDFVAMSEFAGTAIATGSVGTRAIIEPAEDGESNGD